MQRDFNEHHMMQVPISENQLGTMQMTEEVSEHWRMIRDSRFVSLELWLNQSTTSSLLGRRRWVQPKTPSQKMKIEGISETMTTQNTTPQ